MEDVREATKRLRHWRDVGDGQIPYTAGDAIFAADVTALLNSYDQMREALGKCLTDELRRRKDLKTNSPAAGYTDERVAMIRAALAASGPQP